MEKLRSALQGQNLTPEEMQVVEELCKRMLKEFVTWLRGEMNGRTPNYVWYALQQDTHSDELINQFVNNKL